MLILDDRQGMPCEFIVCKGSNKQDIEIEDALVANNEDKHALLKFEDGISVHFVKIEQEFKEPKQYDLNNLKDDD